MNNRALLLDAGNTRLKWAVLDLAQVDAVLDAVLACQERAKALKLRKLFALTTHAAHWFLEQGFLAADVAALPSRRQALYNWKRGSKVFLKRL